MKLVYKGKFSGNTEDLPHGEHKPGAVRFKEPDDPKKLAVIVNIAGGVMTRAFRIGYLVRYFTAFPGVDVIDTMWWFIGLALSLVAVFPHELLHALCFRETVYLYTYWSKGMLFVVGPEPMTRRRFVFMSLLPNLVLGLVPYVLALVWPQLVALGAMGGILLGGGVGDYYNVFHALTQMPRGAMTYLYQFNSWWYLPQEEAQEENQ